MTVKKEETIIYRRFASKAVAGVFTVFAMGRYTVANVERGQRGMVRTDNSYRNDLAIYSL